MILALVKNRLVKEQIQEKFHNVKFCEDISTFLKEIKNYPKIALLIENSATQISGFLISIVLDKLIPDRKFNIYIILNDSLKSFIFSKSFKNIQAITHFDLKNLDIIETAENCACEIVGEIDLDHFFLPLITFF